MRLEWIPYQALKAGWTLMPRSHQIYHSDPPVKLLGIMLEIDVGPPLSTLLRPEMLTNGVRTGQ